MEACLEASADTVNALIDAFVTALVNARIYESDHPRIQSSIAEVQRDLLQFREVVGDDALMLSATKDFLIFKRRPLVGASLASSRLLNLFRAWHSGGLRLGVDATREDITCFFTTALSKPQPTEDFEAVNRRLHRAGVDSIRLLPPYNERVGGHEGRFQVPMRLYQSIVDILQDTTIRVCQGGSINFGPVQEHAEEVLTRLNGAEGPMLSLARQDQYDAFTFGHSVRVAVLSLNFARALTDDHSLLIRIGSAALLHDVGKSQIPFEILHSRHELSADERAVMNTHTELGAEILLDHHESDPLAIAAAFGHHCGCVEGGHDDADDEPRRRHGYPRTLHDHKTSFVTEIIKVCDIYEALTAARPYKHPMTPTRAYRVMLAMQGHVHPGILRRFIEVNGIWPVGQLVRLSSGEIARVVQTGPSLMKPVVEIVRDPDGQPLDPTENAILDLTAQTGMRDRSIRGVADEASVLDQPSVAT